MLRQLSRLASAGAVEGRTPELQRVCTAVAFVPRVLTYLASFLAVVWCAFWIESVVSVFGEWLWTGGRGYGMFNGEPQFIKDFMLQVWLLSVFKLMRFGILVSGRVGLEKVST